ncbi:MAG: S-methyl-5'-thioadenosine phosphorylase [Synergistetes bacterium]|nr:S-methyl-5'-thioadenosine phosphorylase [Synergistota bacterium]MCX8128215.1 S-methyl-5'-thioadenosine phosphorylase [Synergistota bacterium]MDW8192662.1 S-methyl-5'-thioadenosine phosphorylase [Synergistota bacterium]
MSTKVEIGVFGGTGFYELMKDYEEIKIETPYGAPSDKIAIGEVAGKKVAFLPRHGKDHRYPPHMIPYRANLYAFKKLGVKRIIAPCAAGSLQRHVKPGDFVVCDQLVNRTFRRIDTFYDGPIVTHVSFADPYCPELRRIAIEVIKEIGIYLHEKGTVVVIEGPRFSTRAESKWYSQMGWEVINMTQYPEAVLARELEMCYVNISLITDYDVGIEGEAGPVTAEDVIKIFKENIDKARKVVLKMIERIPIERNCKCGEALKYARV